MRDLTVSEVEIRAAVVAAITEHQDSIRPFAATLPEFEVQLIAGIAIERLLALTKARRSAAAGAFKVPIRRKPLPHRLPIGRGSLRFLSDLEATVLDARTSHPLGSHESTPWKCRLCGMRVSRISLALCYLRQIRSTLVPRVRLRLVRRRRLVERAADPAA